MNRAQFVWSFLPCIHHCIPTRELLRAVTWYINCSLFTKATRQPTAPSAAFSTAQHSTYVRTYLRYTAMNVVSHFLFQLFKPRGYFMCSTICFNSNEFCISLTDLIYLFRVTVTRNSDYFPKVQPPACLCNAD